MDIKGDFCLNRNFLLAITLQSISKKNRNVYILVISNYHTFTSKNFRVLGLLREQSEFFIPLETQIGLDFHHNNNQAPLIQNFNPTLLGGGGKIRPTPVFPPLY